MTRTELRALRKHLGLTQEQLAVELDMSRDAVARYESGRSAIPRVVALACEQVAIGRDPAAADREGEDERAE